MCGKDVEQCGGRTFGLEFRPCPVTECTQLFGRLLTVSGPYFPHLQDDLLGLFQLWETDV